MNSPESEQENLAVLAWRHLRFGWWSLLCFLTLGIMLELMHGFKVGWYLNPAYEIRRLMWTLGHAHGTLLALVNVAFGVSIVLANSSRGSSFRWASYRWASPCMMGASILLPGGFFLGGIFTYDGDPGLGVFLVPLGAVLLFVGVLLTAIAMTKGPSTNDATDNPKVVKTKVVKTKAVKKLSDKKSH